MHDEYGGELDIMYLYCTRVVSSVASSVRSQFQPQQFMFANRALAS